jgi:hypothetical protein
MTYRNKLEYSTEHQEIIDIGSLWELKGEKLILVDDDNYVEANLDLAIFQKICE